MAKRRQPRLIGVAPELLLADGGRIVFGPRAKMFGMPDGSVYITGPWRLVKGRRDVASRRNRPRHGLKPGEVLWDNPPGPTQGVTIGSRFGDVVIRPNGVVTPTQASRLMKKSTVWIYRLIKTRKLRTATRRGRGTTLIPLSEVKRLTASAHVG